MTSCAAALQHSATASHISVWTTSTRNGSGWFRQFDQGDQNAGYGDGDVYENDEGEDDNDYNSGDGDDGDDDDNDNEDEDSENDAIQISSTAVYSQACIRERGPTESHTETPITNLSTRIFWSLDKNKVYGKPEALSFFEGC